MKICKNPGSIRPTPCSARPGPCSTAYGLAFWRILILPRQPGELAIGLFLGQLLFAVLWSFAFFGARSPLLGLAVVVPNGGWRSLPGGSGGSTGWPACALLRWGFGSRSRAC